LESNREVVSMNFNGPWPSFVNYLRKVVLIGIARGAAVSRGPLCRNPAATFYRPMMPYVSAAISDRIRAHNATLGGMDSVSALMTASATLPRQLEFFERDR
jgi:hypothetical protein